MKAKAEFLTNSNYDNTVRVLSVLLAVLILGFVLFSKVFRCGRDCQKTISQASSVSQVDGASIGSGPAVATGAWS